jgi:uncharacterized membrane protein YhaH (DUF805 family)
MDIVSHGLWGGIALGRSSRRSYWTAFLFGVAPDLFAFGFLFIGAVSIRGSSIWRNTGHPPPASEFPAYVFQLYSVSHSLVVFALAFALVWLLRGKPLLEMGAWGLHIVTDIFTHATTFFPTPFLWPLAQFRFNGHPWWDPRIFIPNVAVLAALYAVFFWRSRYRARARPG